MARVEPRGEPPMETRPSSAAGRAARAGAPPAPPPSSSRGSPRPDSALPGELVFQGSAERDVALAKIFWGSVTLQPPLESRLGPRREPHRSSASLLAGLPSSPSCALRRSQLLDRGSFYSQASLAEKKGSFHSQASFLERKSSFFSQGSFIDRKEEDAEKPLDPNRAHEKQKYLQKAKRREEILALLRKRREERLMKEVISERHKPKSKPQESKVKISDSDLEDQESVKALP